MDILNILILIGVIIVACTLHYHMWKWTVKKHENDP